MKVLIVFALFQLLSLFLQKSFFNSTTSDHFQARDNALPAEFPPQIMQGKNLDLSIAFASCVFFLGLNTDCSH